MFLRVILLSCLNFVDLSDIHLRRRFTRSTATRSIRGPLLSLQYCFPIQLHSLDFSAIRSCSPMHIIHRQKYSKATQMGSFQPDVAFSSRQVCGRELWILTSNFSFQFRVHHSALLLFFLSTWRLDISDPAKAENRRRILGRHVKMSQVTWKKGHQSVSGCHLPVTRQ